MTENIFIILAVTGGVTLTCYFLASVVYLNLHSRTKNYFTRRSLQKIENSLLKFSYNDLGEGTKEMLRKKGITNQESYDNPHKRIKPITTIHKGYEFEYLRPVLEFVIMTDSISESIYSSFSSSESSSKSSFSLSDLSSKVDGTWLSREQLENNDINNYMKNNNLAAIAHGERITTEQFNLDNDKPKKRNDVYHLKRKIDI